MANKELTTKVGIFETGTKDNFGASYKDDRLLSFRNKDLTKLEVKEGTEIICDRAFYDNKIIEEVVLPESVRAIGDSAFSGCKNLESVNIPEGVTEIKVSTFRDCNSLHTLELPTSCTKIAKWVFSDGLKTLICNAPSMQIDKSAFMNCKTLKTVKIPEGCINAYAQSFLPTGIMPYFEELKSPKENEDERSDDVMLEKRNLSEFMDNENSENKRDTRIFNISVHYLDDPEDLEGFETEIERENLDEAIEYVKEHEDYDRFDYFVIESEDGNAYYNSSDEREEEEYQSFLKEEDDDVISVKEDIVENGESLLPKEFMTIRHLNGKDIDGTYYHGRAALVKDRNLYFSYDSLDEVNSEADFEYYIKPEDYPDDDILEIPESVKTLEELADWILDDWSAEIIEDEYDVVNNEFIIDFWKDNHIFYSKKINKK